MSLPIKAAIFRFLGHSQKNQRHADSLPPRSITDTADFAENETAVSCIKEAIGDAFSLSIDHHVLLDTEEMADQLDPKKRMPSRISLNRSSPTSITKHTRFP